MQCFLWQQPLQVQHYAEYVQLHMMQCVGCTKKHAGELSLIPTRFKTSLQIDCRWNLKDLAHLHSLK